MSSRANEYWHHQQSRWLRRDAARWVRPDAAKFLKPGTDPADVYPALRQQRDARQRQHERDLAEAIAREQAVLDSLRRDLAEINAAMARRRAARKYSEDQPRVPAGNTGGGQWTSGSSGRPRVYITTNPDDLGDAGSGDGGSGLSLPMGSLDFGDIGSEIDTLDLFDIKPKKPRSGGIRLAGDPPRGIGDNGGPPELPDQLLNQHIIRNHVGKTDNELVARIRSHQFPGLFQTFGMDRNGSFSSEENARDFIRRTLEMNRDQVRQVASGEKSQAFLSERFGGGTGREAVLDPSTSTVRMRQTYKVGVSIVHDPSARVGYRIRTAYPRNYNERLGF